jgi:hypothetical protein
VPATTNAGAGSECVSEENGSRLRQNSRRAHAGLVGSDKGIPFILTYNLVPYLEAGNVLIRSSSNRNNRLKTNVIDYAYGGVFKDVRMLVDNQVKEVPTGNLMQAAHFLLDYQISKTPEASGYPIEIVEITAKGRVSLMY